MSYKEKMENAEAEFSEYIDKLNLEAGERVKLWELFGAALGCGEIYGFSEGLKERRERVLK